NRSKSLILRITSLGCATASLPFVKRAKGGGDRGLASRRPFRGYADSVPAMTDTIPLIIQNCPASFRSTVRHAIGMLSAIRPESRPSWAGARTFRARSTTAFFSAANSAWKSSGPRYAFISSSMTSCLIFFSVIPSSVTHRMTPHTKSQIGPRGPSGQAAPRSAHPRPPFPAGLGEYRTSHQREHRAVAQLPIPATGSVHDRAQHLHHPWRTHQLGSLADGHDAQLEPTPSAPAAASDHCVDTEPTPKS